jgi:precorrin-6B methylase 2
MLDKADAALNVICEMKSMPDHSFHRDDNDLFYLPTRVRDIEEAITAGIINDESVFIDVGCGPGARIPVYVALRTKARAIGLEKYEAYYRHARNVVDRLALSRLRVIHDDALKFDYSATNVLLLFRPVDGDKMHQLLNRITTAARETAGTSCSEKVILAGGGSEKIVRKAKETQSEGYLPSGAFEVFSISV